jgi:hypothetical protein
MKRKLEDQELMQQQQIHVYSNLMLLTSVLKWLGHLQPLDGRLNKHTVLLIQLITGN